MHRKIISLLICSVVLGLVIYSNILTASFQFDDQPTIVENPVIKNIKNIPRIWDWDPSRFLTHLSFAANYSFGGLSEWHYHLTNVFIHILVAILVYVLARQTFSLATGSPGNDTHIFVLSAGAALIFLSHPIQTEAVTYVVQRSTLLVSFFYLATLILYILYRTRQKKIYYYGALGTTLLGVFCKPIIVTLPLAIGLYEIFFLRPERRSAFPTGKERVSDNQKFWRRMAPFVLLVMIVPLLLIWWKYHSFNIQKLLLITRESENISRKEYFLTQMKVMVTYLRLLFFPIRQNLDYDCPLVKNFFHFSTLASLVVVLLLLATAVRLFSRYRIISFGIFWFFATLSLESTIFPISDVIFEHRLYLPMFGFALAMSSLLALLLKAPKKIIAAGTLIVIVFSIATYRRNMVWKDPVSLWTDVIKKSPHKARPYVNLGTTFLKAGENNAALEYFEQAIKINPAYPDAYHMRGYAKKMQGRWQEAMEDYHKALALKPDYIEVYNNRGFLYKDLKQYDRALADYNHAIEMNPYFDVAYNNRGNVYLVQSQYDLALADYQKALDINPHYAKAYHNQGTVYRLTSQYDLALQSYQRALDRDPGLAVAYYERALVLLTRRENFQALADLLKAQSLGYPVDDKVLKAASGGY